MEIGIEALRCITAMALASPALLLIYFYTHSLRCGARRMPPASLANAEGNQAEQLDELREIVPPASLAMSQKITRSEHQRLISGPAVSTPSRS